MNEGDFSWVERDDGLFVPLMLISKIGGKRSYFYGGIINLATTKESEIPIGLSILEYALLHIDVFKNNELKVEGNLLSKLEKGLVDEIKHQISDLRIGSKSSVWGYRTIYKYAAEVKA
ncbi:hypothetical protein [Saccharospirillum mangrovi]|uniref:hypothetical protein n=1 Tax=Saccharospirillum mangrovi TaxID=2161747 RepID=UPI0013B42F7A|nr:hypothetical protein [Saccharospirillum mangrovi]